MTNKLEMTMNELHGFELIEERDIPEVNGKGIFYRHIKTGAELLSIINDDDNKVFSINFRTPPKDSTGVAHIMEHSVLCGSKKYPVKEPFVELLKGSLQTFLNAFTYPDKTCYPVASQNTTDLYNMTDVYLDAVFYPRITRDIFKQEGWHYELDGKDEPVKFKGVVFNEMKGAYSSPDSILMEVSQQSLFPDNTYSLDSGGNPEVIPDLTYEAFKNFHDKYYNPSNSRIYVYGNHDNEDRLRFLGKYLDEFDRVDVDSEVALQKNKETQKNITKKFAAGEEAVQSNKGMFTLNWLFPQTIDAELNISLRILEQLLLGMQASPLKKALIDSGLGEGLARVGLEEELRQMYFSTGLKGINIDDAEKVESLIIDTLENLIKNSIDPLTIKAAVNSIEFRFRENNAGRFPQGLQLMLRSLTTWLYGGDPFVLLNFSDTLNEVKSKIENQEGFFENLIKKYLLENKHRSTVLLKPDSKIEKERLDQEKKILASVLSSLSDEGKDELIKKTQELKEIQETPDSPDDLASIPVLAVKDLGRFNQVVPMKKTGNNIFYHDIKTNGILYADIGFNFHTLPVKLLPYISIFGKAILGMGTEKESYVQLSQRIGRTTGGIFRDIFVSPIDDSGDTAAWIFFRGKAMFSQVDSLLDIFGEILLNLKLDDRDRFLQIVLENKAMQEHRLIPEGHMFVNQRLNSCFSESGWVGEKTTGISYLKFLRELEERVLNSWDEVLSELQEVKQRLINEAAVIINITAEGSEWDSIKPSIDGFMRRFPKSDIKPVKWSLDLNSGFEGLIIPSQVNYVGKGLDLKELGYKYHGSANVINKYLRTAWLWEKVRVLGGAYGAFGLFNHLSGIFTFISYRDPNLLNTLDVFDETSDFLNEINISEDELVKSIIGSIGDYDTYMLPDARGYTSMKRFLSGVTDQDRQKTREEILNTKISDFRGFGKILKDLKANGIVCVLGSEAGITESNKTKTGFLKTQKII